MEFQNIIIIIIEHIRKQHPQLHIECLCTPRSNFRAGLNKIIKERNSTFKKNTAGSSKKSIICEFIK